MPGTPTITAPIRLSAPRRVPDQVRVAAFVVALFGVELVLARGLSGEGAAKYALLLIAIAAIALVLRFPLATSLVYFAFTDFIFYPLRFAHQVGPLNVRPYEIALILLLLIAVARPKRRTWGGTAGKALAVFYVFLILSTVVAMTAGRVEFKDALDWGRPFALLAFFYVVVRLFPERREREILLTGAAVIAAVTGVIAVLLTFGAGFGASLQENAGNTVREQGSLDRVRLPGLSASYALFWYAAVQMVGKVGRQRLVWLLIFAGIAANIAFSFNRNMWVGILLGFIVILMAGGTRLRKQFLLGLTLLATAITVFVLLGGAAGNEAVEPVIERGETLIHPSKTADESSLQSRSAETKIAWGTIKEHPAFGVGPGAPFGVFITEAVRTGSGQVIGFTHENQLFLHNQYLYLILVSGIPGLIAFVIFLGTPVVAGLRRRRDDLPTVACALGIGMIMVSGFVAIYFSVVDMTAMLGLLTGVVVASVEDP